MAVSLAEIGKKLSRIFLGRITVHNIAAGREVRALVIATHARTLETYPVRSTPRVGAALFVEWKHSTARAAGPILGSRLDQRLKVAPISFDRLRTPKVKGGMTTFEKRCAAHDGRRHLLKMPQTRRNRANFLKNPPRFAKSSLLAFFSPVFQDCVAKSSLDKASGRLMLWYDEHRRAAGRPSHLLLFRVFEGKEPLRWVWLDSDDKSKK